MKLKFTADPKDWLIFCLFLVLLLYLVAIGVLNLSSLANEGAFHGLNPIEAFTNFDYFKPTMVFFLIFVIVGIASVQSKFWDMEKGIGFSTSKKEKGYSRWAKEAEIKRELKPVNPTAPTSEAAGIALVNDGKTIWVDDSEYHSLIIGSTGSGKTQTVVFPLVQTLAKKGESMILTDPKGELYEKTANLLKNKGYKIIVINLRDPQKGNAWNPFQLPYKLYKAGNSDKSTELLDDLAINILYDEKSQSSDPFWEKTSADYFTGLALGLFEDTDESRININSINLMSTDGEDKFAGSTYIKEYFNMKDHSKPAYVNASSTINAPNETKGSILSVFRQKIKLFSSKENLSEMLSYSDFDMQDIGKEKTAVFLVIQDEKKTYHSLATIFLKQVYETLIDVAQENGGKLPVRTNFILDEFANMPPLKDVTTMITAARSRQIRFNFIIQNFAQLTQVYGKENAETLKGNCGNIIYLISTELQALEEISKLCGEVKSKEKEKTSSTPLVTVSDLQRMKQFEIIVLRIRQFPFKTKFTPDFKMNWGNEKYENATFPIREKKTLNIFDVKEFVKEKKKSNLFDMLDEPKSGPSNMPFNPFGGMPNFGGPSNDDDFNVDDLVKKIDAKIAELEAEEKREKEEMERKQKGISSAADENKNITNQQQIINDQPIIVHPTNVIEPPKPVIPQPKVEIPMEDVIKPQQIDTPNNNNVVKRPVVNESAQNKPNNEISDDQFFDDFFSDE
ncbi:MAG: type IV secretory system conjugative DNA transfer family protein [Bacilli bacterium]|nr:type IV secretory system conjugative DNA transfer family protein [Bacilli bacterium]